MSLPLHERPDELISRRYRGVAMAIIMPRLCADASIGMMIAKRAFLPNRLITLPFPSFPLAVWKIRHAVPLTLSWIV
jgi:hypothetical protein